LWHLFSNETAGRRPGTGSDRVSVAFALVAVSIAFWFSHCLRRCGPAHRSERNERDYRWHDGCVGDGSAKCVMTTNITRFAMDLGDVLIGRSPVDVANACDRAKHTFPVTASFVAGCALGAWFEASAGLWSLALPAGLALVALVIGVAARLDGIQRQ
jgi:Protein of unknown function (DUF1275)